MKKSIITSAVCLIALSAASQSNLAVKYTVSNRDTDSKEPYAREMVLMAGPQKSLFYNTTSLYCDSCNSTPEGKAKLREIQLKAWTVVHPDGTVTYDGRKLGLAPEKQEYLYVEKDRQAAQITVYDFKAGDLYSYTEPIDEIEWTIVEDSTATIQGYECVMARSDYHGRRWTAWFAPELPMPDGPWKLRGLPGIILRADGGDDFTINAKEVGMSPQDIPAVYSTDEYQRGKRRTILADHEHYINNLESIIAAEGGRLNADGSPANLPKYDRQRQAWETDY
ncbi:MAG: GLPGLI family protein [Muribaculaceae bacterium]|nr:GLPGLI family protein [Muribaculaceae bacterium]